MSGGGDMAGKTLKKRDLKRVRTLRAVPLGQGLPPIPDLMTEIEAMADVLLGRCPPPIEAGHLTLLEVADAYYARAAEITMQIQKAEREGLVTKGSGFYRFRTGEVRTFMEMARRAADLGSRRLSDEKLRFEMARHGRESAS